MLFGKNLYFFGVLIWFCLTTGCKDKKRSSDQPKETQSLNLSSKNADKNFAADYEIIFTSLWNSDDHIGIPKNAHFSSPLAVTHNDEYSLWEPNELASKGFRFVAELGLLSEIREEITMAEEEGRVGSTKVIPTFFPNGKEDSTSFEIRVTKDHPFLSFASMIAPSPDWFVGVSGVYMLKNDEFIQKKIITLHGYNAGTEEGDVAGNYLIVNEPTDPPREISTLRTISGLDKPFGILTIERLPPRQD